MDPGNVIVARSEQFSNALPPIEVILPKDVTEVSFVQPLKALLPKVPVKFGKYNSP